MPNSELMEPSAYVAYAVREELLVVDAHLSVKAASKSFYAGFKTGPEHTIGKNLVDLGNGQWNIPALLTRLNELPQTDGRLDDFEMEHDFPLLGHRKVLISARQPPGEGAPSGMILLCFVDVTIQLSEIRYRRLFEAAHDGILILDASTAKVLDVNRFMSELLGFPREHFLGKELWEIGVFKDAQCSKNAMAKLQELGTIRYEDLPLEHKDGRHIPVEFVSNVYREGNREVIQCNIRDITQRKHAEQDLAKAKVDAEAASLCKSQFLANMSHEIRTPMTAILGFAEMLLNKSPDECQKLGCIQVIQRNASHLLELINGILDLSKIESGQMTMQRIPCDLPTLLSEVVSLMRPKALEKSLGFAITFQGSIPRVIQSDPLRLRQILVNLLGNAVKFTVSGTIDVRVMDQGAGGPNIVLGVEVIDTGIGMAPEQLERLFKPFSQGDESITRKFGGTGLGLAISRQLANLLGGDITITSQPGAGSTVTLRIDGGPSAGVERLEDLTETSLCENTNQQVQGGIRLRGRILLVEDGMDNQRLLCLQLRDAGAVVLTAQDGEVAVEMATTQPFDLILMDMQMPVMDGYAATAQLRQRGFKIPIIALTAYAMADDRAKCLASGCDDYLSKPVNEATLLRTVHQHLQRVVSRAPEGAAEGCGPIKSRLADNPRMRTILPEFVKGLPGGVREMNDLLARGDRAALQKVVHQIRGAAGGYGFDLITEPAARAEQSLKAGDTLDAIAAQIHSLIEVIRRIDGYDPSPASLAAQESVN